MSRSGPRRPPREEHDREHERGDDEAELDPEVRADVVVPDRQHEADRRQRERRRAAECALEQHRPGDRPAVARMPARRLEDPHRVAADRGRQDLAGCVGGEVRPQQPAQPVVDAAAVEQLLPAPGHRPDGDDHDRDRREEVLELGVAEDVDRLADVDLPEDVGGAEAGDDERRADPDRAASHPAVNEPRARGAAPRSRPRCPLPSARARAAATAARRRPARRPAAAAGPGSARGTRSAGGPAGSARSCRCSPRPAPRGRRRASRPPRSLTRTGYRWCACRSRGSRATGSIPSSSATAAS